MAGHAARDTSTVGARLSVMMFLQFFVWGAWFVSITGWLNATNISGITSDVYSVGPIAAILSPFLLGIVADRFFAGQRVLAFLHVLGGVALLAVPAAGASAGASAPQTFSHPVVLLLLVHMLCYMPTLGLTNTVSFHTMTNPEKQFPLVRVFGTIGWIVGNWAVTVLPNGDKSPYQFYLAGGAALLLGLYSLTLPHTPPSQAGKDISVREILGVDSLRLLGNRSYFVFVLCSFLICIPLAGYYNQARNFVEYVGFQQPTFTMSFGQISEIFFMLVMPLCFARLGVKWMLGVGMLAWVARYGLFAAGAPDKIMWMALAGVILHGICYDFFFVTGQIYVDKVAARNIRAQAQGFLVLITQGLGMFIGARVFGWIVDQNTAADKSVNWQGVWLTPCIAAAVIMVLFLALFREDRAAKEAAEDEQPLDAPLEQVPAR